MRISDTAAAGLGCAAGLAASSIPVLTGYLCSKNTSLFTENDFLSCRQTEFVKKSGEAVSLCAVAPGGLTLPEEIRKALNSRFGVYGEAQLIKTHGENFITAADFDRFSKYGFNCVCLSFSHQLLYPLGKIKDGADFDRLDALVELCQRHGMYAILNLSDAHTFAKKDKRTKNLLALWKSLAAHYRGCPAVAAYSLACPPLNSQAFTPEGKKELDKYYNSAIRAIRKSDAHHIIILEFALEGDFSAQVDKYAEKNIACGLTNSHASALETESLLSALVLPSRLPTIIFENRPRADALSAYGEKSLSWVFGGYKAALPETALFSGAAETADINTDSYDELLRKWGEPLRTQNGFSESNAISADLRLALAQRAQLIHGAEAEKSRLSLSFSAGIRKGRELFAVSKQEGV